MQIFELFMEPITYIRFITQFSPILFSFIAIIDSAYNTSLKGILYVFGVLLTFSIGKLLSASFPYRVPGIEDGMNEKDFGSSKLESDKYAFKNPKFHPSCNLLSKPDHAGWGTFYSSPDMYALFYSFTLIYIISCMMGNNDINIFFLTILIFFFILSSYFRTQQFYCVEFRDILIGLVIGSFLGFLWYIFVSITEASLKVYDLTYFNTNKENPDKCAMKNKQFRCKKIKIPAEKDENLNQIKMDANDAAMAALTAQQALNTTNNFDMIWDLYHSILKKQLTKAQTNIELVVDYNKFDNLSDKNINNEITNDSIISYSFDTYKEYIYGINNQEIFDEDISSNKIYLYQNNKYKFYTNEGTINDSDDKPKLFEVLCTNYILFKKFIEEYTNKEGEDTPNVITTIKTKIDNDTNNNIYPIKLLKDHLSDMTDYSKITKYILTN